MALNLLADVTPCPYRSEDHDEVLRLLEEPLAARYPGGGTWLRRRLRDVEAGAARCYVQRDGEALVGVAIETPKAPGNLKLSTLWVAPAVRRRGFGRALVRHCLDGWRRDGLERVHVTAADDALPAVAGVLEPIGFAFAARELDRYGPGRDETVLIWTG